MPEPDLGSNGTARPHRRRRLLAGGLAVVLAAGASGYLAIRSQHSSAHTAGADPVLTARQAAQQDAARKQAAWSKADQSTCRRLDASYRTAQALTAAMSANDEKAFMALARSAPARRAMSRWWSNVHALGFTTGGALHIYPFNPPNPPPTSSRYKIAWHSSLDGSSPRQSGTELVPDAGATDYELTSSVRWDGQQCIVSIKKWTGLSHAPWDLPQRLYVKRTAHSIAAGEQRNRAAVDHAAQLSEPAYTWLHGFLTANRHEDYLRPTGFLVFVPTTGRQGLDWFTAGNGSTTGSGARAASWIDDPDEVAGLAHTLPNVTPTLPRQREGGEVLSPISEIGTTRVIFLPAGVRGQPLRFQQGLMVHEMTHATFDNLSLYGYVPDRPAVSVEGAASFVEAVFRADPASYRGRPMPELLKRIRPHARRFTGQLPGTKDVYGKADLQNYYYGVSGAMYAYIANRSGTPAALQAIHAAHEYGRFPFDAVITRRSGTTVKFADGAKLQQQWATWLRTQL